MITEKERLRQDYLRQVANTSATTNLPAHREALRQSKHLEKEIQALQASLMPIELALRSSSQRFSQIDHQVQVQSQQVQEINRQIEQEQRDPAISRLQQERSQAVAELNNSQSSFVLLNEQIARSTSHVTMCYGYLELSVKYPTALKVTKKLVKQGCARYVPVQKTSELEELAQTEVLAAACR